MRVEVFVDFDGTIAVEDTTDLLLERFADACWRDIEEEWKAGKIGSRECMTRQIDLVRMTRSDFEAFVNSIDIDPHFPPFRSLCEDLGHQLTVVSDGIDLTVSTVLRRAGLRLRIKANRLEWIGEDRWRLTFPHCRSDCETLAGNCKCHFAPARRSALRVLVGDGRSDFCLAGRVDLTLSKGSLTQHCERNGLPHMPIADFADAERVFRNWLAARVSAVPHPLQMADE